MKAKIKSKKLNIKTILFLTIILGIVSMGIISCEKPPNPYLKKWMGTYECEEVYSWWRQSFEEPSGGIEGKERYQTKIEISSEGDYKIKIVEKRMGKIYFTEVNKEGNILYDGQKFRDVRGSFSGDSIYIIIFHVQAMGASSTSHYEGIKLKNKKQ
jgi:hypothetical protein